MKKSKKILLILIPAVVCLALAVGALWAGSHYVLVQGRLYPMDITELDLRDTEISRVSAFARCRELKKLDLRGSSPDLEAVFALQQELPDCQILWDIPLGDIVYDCTSEAVTLEDVPANWENLRYFPVLRQVEFTRCTDPAAAENVADALPGAVVLRNYALAGQWYPHDTEAVTVSAGEAGNICEELKYFRDMKSVTIENGALPADTLRSLKSLYPGIAFTWNVPAGEVLLPAAVTELPYEGKMPALSALEAVLDLLPELKTVALTVNDAPAADMVSFRAAHPELEVTWTVLLFDQEYPNDTAELDLHGQRFSPEQVGELEAVLPYFPALTKIDMSDCGLSDEEMDALNTRWPDIEIVWTLYFKNYALRTDATYFIPSSTENLGGLPLVNGDLDILRYCPHMQGLDLGHQYFDDLSFLYYTPHVKYLILVECPISDITPIGSLKELKYAELFDTFITDLSPLVNCTSLTSVNLSYLDARHDTVWETLSQMPWLKRLWYCNIPLSGSEIRQLEANGTYVFNIPGGEPTGGTWRYDDAYYEMRDFFGNMWYMPGGTNGLDEDGNQIVIDDWGVEYHLENWDLTQRWWELPQFAGENVHILGITY